MCIYTYDDLLFDLSTFPSVHAVGRSAFDRRIWLIRVGQGMGGGLVHGAIHAREHVTAPLVVAMAENYARHYRHGMPPIDFIPMVNPDGVALCAHGTDGAPFPARQALLRYNGGDPNFALWKANGQGVDLNNNFPADWGRGKDNVFAPAPMGYVGAYPLCAPEARALARVTCRRRYACTLSYHCKGEVIYYGFAQGDRASHSRERALQLAARLGYEARTSVGSAGGYKDWYALHHPDGIALTVEVGEDCYEHPFPYSRLPDLMARHADVPLWMADVLTQKDTPRRGG